MKTTVEVKPTPKQVAEIISKMYSDEQAEMFGHLVDAFGGEHYLMMQFMCTRDHCEDLKKKGNSKALDAFLCMFSSAYKYMGA